MRGKVKLNLDAIKRVRTRMVDKRKKVQSHRVSIGIHEEEGQEPALNYQGKEAGISLVELALIHEYGAGNVPERSYLRAWFDQNYARLLRESTAAMRLEARGEKGVVEQLAQSWTAELVEWIHSGAAGLAPLSPQTQHEREVAGLEPAPPLEATGQLVKAIRVVIENA